MKRHLRSEAGILRFLQNGAGFDAVKIKECISDTVDTKCRHCGEEGQTTIHTIWECKAFKEEREKAAPRLNNLPINQIPKCVLLGVPPAMECTEAATYWGQK